MDADPWYAATIAVLAVQALVFWCDELVFHRQRGLRVFERWGHVADSLAFSFTLMLPAFLPATNTWIYTYVACGIFSCLLVTKDEWVHTAYCSAMEHWLHALLFLIHPVLMVAVGMIWVSGAGSALRLTLPFVVGGVALYQFVIWILLKGRPYGPLVTKD